MIRSLSKHLARAVLSTSTALFIFLTVQQPKLAFAQEQATSLWYRLAPDSTIESKVAAIVEFNKEQMPLVRVNPRLVDGRDMSAVHRALISLYKSHGGSFPTGRNLKIVRENKPAFKPDTVIADSYGVSVVKSLHQLIEKQQKDASRSPVLNVLIKDESGKM